MKLLDFESRQEQAFARAGLWDFPFEPDFLSTREIFHIPWDHSQGYTADTAIFFEANWMRRFNKTVLRMYLI